MDIRSLAVFCGSSNGRQMLYRDAATEMGQLLAREQIKLVYGGGKNGMMGTVADAALAAGGHVHGVMLQMFEQYEVCHRGLTELEMVPDMHIRKKRMEELSDAFVIMPGGAGTMDEFFEQWTWMQIGIHSKPCAILNTNGFYDGLLAFIRNSLVGEGYLLAAYADALIVANTPAELLSQLRSYVPLESKTVLASKVAAGRRD